MKNIFIITPFIIVSCTINGMDTSRKSAGLTAFEQKISVASRRFQDCQNSIHRAVTENNFSEIAQLIAQRTGQAEDTISAIISCSNDVLGRISPSTRSKIIAMLHQSDCRRQFSETHERFLYSLTNKIPGAELADWAIEYDLTCAQNNEPQRYGTLINPDSSLEMPIAGYPEELTEQDYKILNMRRRAVGLPRYDKPS